MHITVLTNLLSKVQSLLTITLTITHLRGDVLFPMQCLLEHFRWNSVLVVPCSRREHLSLSTTNACHSDSVSSLLASELEEVVDWGRMRGEGSETGGV